jgi:cysteine desulfurase family protein (TIGR01976 family)
MAYDIECVRSAFPSLSETDGGQPRIYFDNPGGTQICQRSIDRMNEYLVRANTNTHGPFRTSRMTDEIIHETHAALADFVGADDPGEIVFGQNMTTITLHLSRSLAHLLNEGDEVVVTRMDHDANISPWLLVARDRGCTVRWIDFDPQTYRYDEASVDAAITEKTRIVAVGYASNAIGTVNDVASVAEKAHAVGALVFVDAVQFAPHFVMDVKAIGCDMLACSPYKFYGPHQGMAWARRDLLESLSPYKVRPADDTLPSRFETGTQSHEGMAATLGAVEHFEWMGTTMGAGGTTRRERLVSGMEVLIDYERDLTRHLISGLQAIPGVTVHGLTLEEDLTDRVPTVGMVKEGSDPDSLARRLAEANIFTWPGHYYAIEVIERLGLSASGGMLRIGLGQYNTVEEINRLLNVLDARG